MSAHFAGWDRRTLDLALQEVTVGLSAEERAELRTRASAEELESLEFAVAELTVAALGELEAPPASVMRRLSADAGHRFGFPPPAGPDRGRPRGGGEGE